jgi:hypothetical protein
VTASPATATQPGTSSRPSVTMLGAVTTGMRELLGRWVGECP